LQGKTTYPPILLSNITYSVNTNLSPQAQRDTDTPDLGYHYDPIDYFVDTFAITNAVLTVSNGTVIAGDNNSAGGIWLQDGSSIISIGTPLAPNWFVRYSSVQEQPVSIGPSGPGGAYAINPYHLSALAPTGSFRFTKFACPAVGGIHLYHNQSSWSYADLLVQDCEFWGGESYFDGNTNTAAILKNNLFVRSTLLFTTVAGVTNDNLSVSNNLFWNETLTVHPVANSNIWFFFNNDFDGDKINNGAGGTSLTMNGYNAYLNYTNRLNPTNAFDIVSTSSLAYQTGSLGAFYQPTSSPLINAGSTTADQVGLYHYTTQTNQVPETNSIVDIGYHYVATDAYGNPLDSNGDGIPDYLQDANGNGIFDAGDLGEWQNSPYGLAGANGLQVFTPLKP
jgi:hypothetical protein